MTPGPIKPARELLGDMLIELGQPAEALKEFEASHRVEPNRFQGLYGAARAAELAGDRARARTYYGRLVTLGKDADADRSRASEELKASTSIACGQCSRRPCFTGSRVAKTTSRMYSFTLASTYFSDSRLSPCFTMFDGPVLRRFAFSTRVRTGPQGDAYS